MWRTTAISALVVLWALVAVPAFATDPVVVKPKLVQPLKVIAPDLIIETAEQGEFHKMDKDGFHVDPLSFKRTDVVPHKDRYMFGWRMKVTTTRKFVLVQERSPNGKGRQGQPFQAIPKEGYIFNATDVVVGVPRGKRSTRVYVEDVPIETFTSTVK